MKRTVIQPDERTHELLRRRACERRASMAALVRETLAAALEAPAPRRRTIRDFRSVAIGRSPQAA
ncbi:MAG TPA: hypothetical protein VNI83_00070 [Vicinamibacterales bacterium]|nr:hypothetical protein [Vicinamibacterales bacterium]